MSKYNQNQQKFKIKLGDSVKIIAGDHKGDVGVIKKFLNKKNTVIIEGVNIVTKHKKPNTSNPKGGIRKIEAPIHISNVMLVEDEQTVRVGYKFFDMKKVRFSKKTENII